MIDGNDIWEALFGIMKGNVPDEMTEDVCEQLAARLTALQDIEDGRSLAGRAVVNGAASVSAVPASIPSATTLGARSIAKHLRDHANDPNLAFIIEGLCDRLDDATQALADYRGQPYATWEDRDPEDTLGAMIDNQAWVMMSHIGSFIGYRDGDPDLMERWQEDWAENYPSLLKGWFSPHRMAARYVADRLTIRRAQGIEAQRAETAS